MEKGRIEFCISLLGEILNNLYFLRPFEEEKRCSAMEKGRNEFSITSLEPRGNSEPNGNVQIFCSINSKCVFFKTI